MVTKSITTCAPNVDVDSHYTCFTTTELRAIARAFNDALENDGVCRGKQCVQSSPIDVHQTKRRLWKSIYTALKPICPYEGCWVDLGLIKRIHDPSLRSKIRYFTIKPKMTKSANGWLSTSDINYVLQQYERSDPGFFYAGALPSDFYLVHTPALKALPLYHKIGYVFNLDTHDGPGTHWVALFINTQERRVEYFDSTGAPPTSRILRFVNMLRTVFPKNAYRYVYSKVRHQQENSECGVYAVYFITQRVLGRTFENVIRRVVDDATMHAFRRVIFRT